MNRIFSEEDVGGVGQHFNLSGPLAVVGFNLGDAVIGFEVVLPATHRPADPCCPTAVRLPSVRGLAVVTEGADRLVLTAERPHCVLQTPEGFSIRPILLEGTLTGEVFTNPMTRTYQGNYR